MGQLNGNTANAQPGGQATPAQPENPWMKLLKGGLQGTAKGLQSYGQQQQQIQQPMRNQFYGQ